MPYLELIVMSTFAIVFYRAGRREHSWPFLWAVGSIGCSFLAMRFTRLGAIGMILAHLILVVTITLHRAWRDGPGRKN